MCAPEYYKARERAPRPGRKEGDSKQKRKETDTGQGGKEPWTKPVQGCMKPYFSLRKCLAQFLDQYHANYEV